MIKIEPCHPPYMPKRPRTVTPDLNLYKTESIVNTHNEPPAPPLRLTRANKQPTPRAGPKETTDTRHHQLLKTRIATVDPSLEVALCHDAYNKISIKAQSNAKEKQTTRVASMPRTSLCIIIRCGTKLMGITTHNLVKTTTQLMEANGGHIKLDDIVFLNLTLGDSTGGRDKPSGRMMRWNHHYRSIQTRRGKYAHAHGRQQEWQSHVIHSWWPKEPYLPPMYAGGQG